MILALYQAYSKISFRDYYQIDNFFSLNRSSQKKKNVKIAAKICLGERLFAFFDFRKLWNDNFFLKKIEKW